MSTVKANNHQIGQSGTATNNFTLYQPSTPDGTVRLAVGNSGATTGDVLSVSNTGLSVTGTLSATGNVTLQPGVVISGSSSGDALRITQTGAGNALLVEDDTNPDSTPFVVNASGSVGIGTSSPQQKLHVVSTSSGAATYPLMIENGASATGTESRIFFVQGGNTTRGAYIGGRNEDASGAPTSMVFGVSSAFAAPTERMRLDSSGNLGLGVTPSNALDVQKAGTAASTTDLLELTNSGNAASMTNTGTGILFNQFYYDATTPAVADAGRIAVKTGGNWTSTASTQDAYMTFETALDGTVAERARITSGGNLLLKDTNDVTVTGPSSAVISALSVGGSFIISVAFSVASPYTQNIQIDITWANWGSNNVIGLVDLMAQARQWADTSGAAFGKVFATNTGATATFSTFNTTDITTSQCTLTAASGGNYTLRLTINPTNNMDAAGVYLTIPRGIAVLPTTVAVSLV